MAPATVYFVAVEPDESLAGMADKTVTLIEAAGFAGLVHSGRACALKQHFGEGDNTGYIKPEITRAVADWVKQAGGKPFVTDTNTLYRGRRGQTVDHLEIAREHGFTHEALGAPVIIADGLMGVDQVSVPIRNGTHFSEVRIAAAAYQAASCIVLTHVKGHCQGGMAAAVKNVGMGFAARAGKLAQHHEGYPIFNAGQCRACGICAQWCPADAIEVAETAQLDAGKCIGCGECLALCPHAAIDFNWNGHGLIEKMCEHVLGFLSNKKNSVGYLNFLTDVTKNCDCVGSAQTAAYPDVGIIASDDIVAVEKATSDLSREYYGKDIWLDWWPRSDYQAMFGYAEQLGLGTAEYRLVRLQ